MAIAKRSPVKTAIVVGGGIVGLSCALNLAKKGIATIIVDPATQPRAASWGNAGHIAVEQVEPLASPATVKNIWRRLLWRGGPLSLPPRDIAKWLPFAIRLLFAAQPRRFAAGKIALAAVLAEALPAWQRMLDDACARDLLCEDGHFVVWETARSAENGRANWTRMDIGTARFRDATVEEMASLASLMEIEPAGAIRFLGSGQIADLEALEMALNRQYKRLGGIRRVAIAERFEVNGDKACLILGTGEVLKADAIIVAAGAASGELMAQLGYTVPIISERGYHIEATQTDWPVGMPPVVFEDRSVIVTRFLSGLRAAGFVEFANSDSAPDPRKWTRLRAHVGALGLSFAMPGKEWMGARPTLPDYLPAIGRSRSVNNVYYAFGHQHLGLTLAPVTGEAIAAMVVGAAFAIDLGSFDLERFGKIRRRHAQQENSPPPISMP